MLDTPYLGFVTTIQALLQGQKIGPGRTPTEVLATMRGIDQLFPRPLNNGLVTAAGAPLDRDHLEVEIWRRFERSVFDPEATRPIPLRGA